MRSFFGSLVGIAAFALLSPVFSAEEANLHRALSVLPASREMAPDFSLQQVGGKSVELSSYKGNLVLLGFFKTF